MGIKKNLNFSLSYKKNGAKYNLRIKAWETAYKLSGDISELVRKENFYKVLVKTFGEDVASILVVKELFKSLFPLMREYERRIVLKNESNDLWKTPIWVHDKTLIPYINKCIQEKTILFIAPDFIKGLLLLARSILKFSSNKIKSTLAIGRLKSNNDLSKIGVDLNEGVALPNKRSEFNWFKGSDINPRQVCLCLFNDGYSEFQNTKEEITFSKYVKDGILIISNIKKVTDKLETRKMIVPIFVSLPVIARKSVWLRSKYLCWKNSLKFWQIFFNKLNIKVWFISNEDSQTCVIQRAAIEANHGITVLRQRSVFPIYSGIGYHPAHLAMTWSHIAKTDFKISLNKNECIVPVGHSFILNRDFDENKKYATKIREKLLKAGAKFIIVFFDTNYGPDFDFTKKMMFDLIKNICEYVLANKDIAIIVKLKKEKDISALLEPEIYKKLTEQKRLKIFTKNILPHALGSAGDISIGIGISSAALEINSKGLRAIHYYPACIESHFLYQKNYNKILFTDCNLMIKAIENLRINGSSDQIGLVIDNMEDFVAFTDGRSNERVSSIIRYALTFDLKNRANFYKELKNNLLKD